MAYRSEVGIAIGFRSKDDCDAFIVTYKLKEPEFWRDVVADGYWKRADDRVLTAHMPSVEWGDAHPDVKQTKNMMVWAADNHNAEVYFLRIGEAVDDIDYYFMGESMGIMITAYVQVSRKVTVLDGEPLSN